MCLAMSMMVHNIALLGWKTTGWDQLHEKRYLKTLFTLSRCWITRIRVLKTDSPNHQCMQVLGVESYGGSTTTERGKIEARIDVFWNWPIGYLYRPI